MKIALIIFRVGPSHGSLLQTYALNKVLQGMGHEVTIIDRQHPFEVLSSLKHIVARIVYTFTGKYRGPIFYTGDYSSTSMKELKAFVNIYLIENLLTIRNGYSARRLCAKRFDAYIVGSDQTWRPKYVYDIYYYFLDFVPESEKVKRIAYAPSFGTAEWEYSQKQERKCRILASRFNAISVRESDGVKLCKDHLGIEAQHVLDPTLLLEMTDYLSMIDSIIEESPFIAYSLLDDKKEYDIILNKLSSLYNLPLKRINSNVNCRKCKDDYIEPGIKEWLSHIYNARFVVTDSFHATVFSIIFNVPFVTIANPQRGLSRLRSLLEMTGLSNRMVVPSKENIDELINEDIDWDIINRRVADERKKSMDFLIKSLS